MENQINPWVRADLHNANPETEALVPSHLQREYRTIMAGMLSASIILTEAQVSYNHWTERRAEFFSELINPVSHSTIDNPLADPRSIARPGEW